MRIITGPGLWVSSSFTDKFGNKDVTPANTVPPFKTLAKDMLDSEIQKELGATECTLGDIAAFLENPPEGANNGYANIFYLPGFVVDVCWGAGSREWSVSDWPLDDYRWGAGRRVFSRNWSSDPQNQDLDTLPSVLMINGITYKRV